MFRKILFLALAVALAASACVTTASAKSDVGEMRDITTMELVRDMGIGINLGNTFESCGDWIAQWGDGTPESYYTAWGSPVITEDIIRGYAEAGFGVLRVPVAWSNLMGSNYTISTEYMARVRQAVDWALKYDMYVIINLHYDNGWLENFPTDTANCMKKYQRIWEQVCEEFRDYGDHLMFESQNEELGWGSVWNEWSGTDNGKAASYALANSVNQKFVDVVRASGGNNAQRHLLISGYNTDIVKTADKLFRMPDDPAGRCALSVHYYTPVTFALITEDVSWGKTEYYWGDEEDLAELEKYMNIVKTSFIDKGIPVIIGEYGCPYENKDPESVEKFLAAVCETAYDVGACPVLWDTPGGRYDRSTCKMTDAKLLKKLMKIPDSKPDTSGTQGQPSSLPEFALSGKPMAALLNFMDDLNQLVTG